MLQPSHDDERRFMLDVYMRTAVFNSKRYNC